MTNWILGAGFAMLWMAAPALAQPLSPDLYSYATYASRVQTLESELARVQAQVASYEMNSHGYIKAVDNKVYGQSSWTLGAEIAALKPHIGFPEGEEFNFDATPRVWLGFESATGLGTRVTYWQFDSSNRTGMIGLEAHTLDWDISQRGQFQNWDIMVFGGLRYTKFSVGSSAFDGDFLAFEGLGPTLGAEVRRPFGEGGFALVANLRGSILFDDSVIFDDERVSDGSMSVWQTQLGIEWSRHTFWSCHLVVRAMYEAQRWQGPTMMGIMTPTVSLGGPVVSVGILR